MDGDFKKERKSLSFEDIENYGQKIRLSFLSKAR
jgi:hypothetical protein